MMMMVLGVVCVCVVFLITLKIKKFNRTFWKLHESARHHPNLNFSLAPVKYFVAHSRLILSPIAAHEYLQFIFVKYEYVHNFIDHRSGKIYQLLYPSKILRYKRIHRTQKQSCLSFSIDS